MRLINKTPGNENMKKMVCAHKNCAQFFYTDNQKTKFCCDSCRYKGFKERHAPKLSFLKSWQDKFKLNAAALKRLFDMDLKNPTSKELRIAGFDFNIRDQQRTTNEGRTAFVYFDYALIISKDSELYEIIYHPNI